MANSRLISSADLVTAEFDDVADNWAERRGIGGEAKLNATVVGVAPDANDLGTGFGPIVGDEKTVKDALISLEENLASNQIQPVLNLITDVQEQLDTLIQTPLEVTTALANITNDATIFYVMNSASAQTLTLLADLTEIAVGGVVNVVTRGVGSVTIAAGSGVTIQKSTATLVISAQYKAVQLLKIAANEWIALGSFN